MIRFHAVMLDETGCEFGATIEARTRHQAYEIIREDFPESRCIQLESPTDTARRERALYERMERIYNGEIEDDYDY
jgi:hypothetical protein